MFAAAIGSIAAAVGTSPCNAQYYQRAVALPKASTTKYDGYFLPVYASSPLDGDSQPNIKSAVIFIHGASRDADSYFCAGTAQVALSSPTPLSVLTIAPMFGNASISSSNWMSVPSGATTSVYWLHPKEWSRQHRSAVQIHGRFPRDGRPD